MDKHTIDVLEYDKVLKMAASFAVTAPGRREVLQKRPVSDYVEISKNIDLISECRRLLSEGLSSGVEHFEDLSSLLKRIVPSDSGLEPMELRAFLPFLSSAINLRELNESISLPALNGLLGQIRAHPGIKKKILWAIDREGHILDQASPELKEIRGKMKSLYRKIKSRLEDLLKTKELSPHIRDFFLTERNGRWVIPVKRDSKGHIPGVVHDISNTGETLFVEPYEIQQVGNELESYRAEEKVEELRILRSLTGMLRSSLDEIQRDYETVIYADVLFAMSGFADSMDMSPPEINTRGCIKIIQGRHPLLWQALRKADRGEELVPLDFELGMENTCMVITGSNTGGKTLTLKTVGILNLMALTGMHVPANSGTSLPILNSILADIGDEQSIEENLSTFSAHTLRISDILNVSTGNTLVIIDELGTGTDPEEGGAIACAILKRLREKRVLTVVSTHLGILKAFAHAEEGIVNGAMEMTEIQTEGAAIYKPSYRLKIGKPGRSHAFEIARRYGMPPDIIADARNFLKDEGLNMEALMEELREGETRLKTELMETGIIKKEIQNLRDSLTEEISRIREMRKEIRLKALKDADEVLRRTKTQARDIIKMLKDNPGEKKSGTLKEIDTRLLEIKKRQAPLSLKEPLPLNEIEEGMKVYIDTLGISGIIQSVNRKSKRCRVKTGAHEIEVAVDALSAIWKHEAGEEQTVHTDGSSGQRETRPSDFFPEREIPPELNLIGKRVDPAISTLERYLNDASIIGVPSVKIIHGIGTGSLSRAIRNHLKSHPLVKDFHRGGEEEGGDAVTIVHF